jgi:hypothetical protein
MPHSSGDPCGRRFYVFVVAHYITKKFRIIPYLKRQGNSRKAPLLFKQGQGMVIIQKRIQRRAKACLGSTNTSDKTLFVRVVRGDHKGHPYDVFIFSQKLYK